MAIGVKIAEYGRPAGSALSSAVSAAKGGSALAPVTVICRSHFGGLAARRMLGSGMLTAHGERKGIANVSFVTPHRLAESLAPDQLLDRRPLTNPMLGAAVRMALREEPGEYLPVARHHATEVAIASLYGELDTARQPTLDRLASEGGEAGASAVRMYDAVARRLNGFHGDADVARVAAGAPDLASRLEPFGHLIWYLPEPLTAPLIELLRTVFTLAPTDAIVGTTGTETADAPIWHTVESVGGVRPSPSTRDQLASTTIPTAAVAADRIISVTDPDEEVRVVVRCVLALAEAGTPFDRIGVFFPTSDPYVGILEQQLRAADIPTNGPSRSRLADSVAGLALMTALALPEQEWRRDRVMALVSSVPVQHPDLIVRPSTWERASRAAGVIKGRDDWRRKLALAAERKSAQQANTDPDEQAWLIRRLEREQGDLRDLATFVGDLDTALSAVIEASTWPAKSEAALSLLHHLLGRRPANSGWPEDEQTAFEQVEKALIRLGGLDAIEPEASHATFVAALETELDVRRGRNGRYGEGVLYAPLGSAGGLDLDAVFILGCAEGRLPSGRTEDAMLPDQVRELSGGDLELRAHRIHHEQRDFLAALATAPAGTRTITFPRGDLRSGRESLPSRWLLDTASALAGHTVYSTEFNDLKQSDDKVYVAPSHSAGILDFAVHTSIAERDLATLAMYTEEGGDVLDDPVSETVKPGLQMQRARSGKGFTQFDGNLETIADKIPSTADKPQSPSRLQSWVACGFRYYLGSVLGLSDREDPEQIIELSPLERGSAVHLALELFIEEAMASGTMPEPNHAWSPGQRDRLREIAEETFADLEHRGVVGRDLHWRFDRLKLLALLDEFLDSDDKHRAKTGTTPISVELPFGLKGAKPVEIPLSDGRTLQFRGFADRVDRDQDGTFYVSDYKTGKDTKYKVFKGDDADPTQKGTLLQLGLYAEAAKQLLDAEHAEAHYWMVDGGSGFARHGYAWTPQRLERLTDVVEAIVGGIERGVFNALPGEWEPFGDTHENCRYCAFDNVCPKARREHALEKADAPEFKVRLPLEETRDDIVDAFDRMGGAS